MQERPREILTTFKTTCTFLNMISSKKAMDKSASNIQKLDDLKNEIAYLEYQHYHASVNMERMRQDLEGIDFFFANFGYHYKFNVVTQMMLYQRDEKERQFDKICKDLYEMNRALVCKREQAEEKEDIRKMEKL